MKSFVSFACSLLCSMMAFTQCEMDFTFEVNDSGSIVTSNNSSGADPASYIWYVYNLDLNPWVAEYLESADSISYDPMYTGDYLICLVGTEIGTNAACDSLCLPLTYTQEMMDSQTTTFINDLENGQEVVLYPNPSSELVYLNSELKFVNDKVEVRDLLGNRFYPKARVTNGKTIISVGHLFPGHYFLILPDSQTSLRFVVR